MKKIIEDKIFGISLTKCFDDETNKYYKFKEIKTGKLLDAVLTKFYSEERYGVTDIEVDGKPFNK